MNTIDTAVHLFDLTLLIVCLIVFYAILGKAIVRRLVRWARQAWERIDREALGPRIDRVVMSFCRVFVVYVVAYTVLIVLHALNGQTFRQLTNQTIDTSAPAPLVPCSAYYVDFGDSIVMSDQGYSYVWVGTHDIHRAPEVFQCSTELGNLQAAR